MFIVLGMYNFGAGVGKNEEKNDNLSSSDVIVFPHILSNTGSQLAELKLKPAQGTSSLAFMHERGTVIIK